MIHTPQAVVNRLLRGRPCVPRARGAAFAPANIALVKYWGKRDRLLNLPATSSLSISLGRLGTQTSLEPAEQDAFVLQGVPLPADHPAAIRLTAFLDLFRSPACPGFRLVTDNTVPTAAGLASSASGFAALVLALEDLFRWKLDRSDLSVLARMGSGSACRSVLDGFVEWTAGRRADGMDSRAHPLDVTWPDFRIALLLVDTAAKAQSSREAMAHTVKTSALYETWPAVVRRDLRELRAALRRQDFPRVGALAEGNALAMHATMLAARPAVCYWKPQSLAAMHVVFRLRAEGLPLYFTMDAGPNLKLLFLREAWPAVREAFPQAIPVAPFIGG